MDKATIRHWVFDVLRDEPQTHIHAIEARIRQRVADYEKADALTLQEVVWELLVRGVLAPGKNSLNLQLPFVHLTDFGAACLDDDLAILPDVDRYMANLSESIGPRIDKNVLRSIHEALLCYLDGLEDAALVLLGVAIETCFLDLEKQTINSFPVAAQRQAASRRIARGAMGSEHRFSLLLEALRTARGREAVLPHESDLLEMSALLRRVRTAGGGPAMPAAERPMVHAALLSMPRVLRTIDALLVTETSAEEPSMHRQGEPARRSL